MMRRLFILFAAGYFSLLGGKGLLMAETKPYFESGRLDFGLTGNVEIPSLTAGPDGRIYCVFSQNTQTIWLAATSDGGRTWEKPSKVMSCPGPGYITDANVLACPDRLTVFATYVPDDPNSKTRHSQFLASTRADGGTTWTKPEALPIAHHYPVGKIHTPVWLNDKTVVMGYSWDLNADLGKPFRDEPGMCIKSGVLISTDAGRTWTPGKDVPDIDHPFGLDEPAIVRLNNGNLFMILRAATPHPYETLSRDGGKTWDAPKPSAFFGYNSPAALLRLRDGGILRAWDNSPIARFPLVVSLSGVFAHRPAEPAGLNAGHAGLPMRKNIVQRRPTVRPIPSTISLHRIPL